MICPYPIHSETYCAVCAAMSQAQRAIGPIAKRGTANLGTYTANFVTFEDLTEAILIACEAPGLLVTQPMLPFPGEPQRTMRVEIKKESKSRDEYTWREFKIPCITGGVLRTQITHIATGEWLASDWPICAPWADPQEVRAVISHWKRYALEDMFLVAREAPGKYKPPQTLKTPVASMPTKPQPIPGVRPPAPSAPKDQPAKPDDLSDFEEFDPGQSGENLYQWLYGPPKFGGCGEPRVAEALDKIKAKEKLPADVSTFSPEQARRAYTYCRAKLERYKVEAKQAQSPPWKEVSSSAGKQEAAQEAPLPRPQTPPKWGELPPVAAANANGSHFDEFSR